MRQTLCFGNVLLPIFAFIHISISPSTALQCYKCYATPPIYYVNETIRLCKDFDYSDKYLVNCPFSTFCMKRVTSAKVPYPINGTERDCASQRYESQNLTNGTWHQVVSVEEPYEEGCSYVNDKGLLSATIQNCYCKGDTCNTSTRISTSNRYVFCAVILFCTFYFG